MPYARAPGRSVTAATSGRARRDSLGTSIGHEAARDGRAPYGPAALGAPAPLGAGAAIDRHRYVHRPAIGRLPPIDARATAVEPAPGRAVAGRDVPTAGWIGAIAANAPDWSELVLKPDLWPPRAGGEYLVFHRGITHSFVGAVVEAAVLTGLFGLLLRLWARRAMVPAPLWRWVATCVTATVASHLYLDCQGSYGLRPFLPCSAQWYYGDWVAIVDPFFWVVPLVGLAWGARRHWAPALVYLVTLLGVTTLVLWRGHDLVVWWVRLALVGCAAAGVVGWTRHWFGVAGQRRAAAYGLVVLAA